MLPRKINIPATHVDIGHAGIIHYMLQCLVSGQTIRISIYRFQWQPHGICCRMRSIAPPPIAIRILDLIPIVNPVPIDISLF